MDFYHIHEQRKQIWKRIQKLMKKRMYRCAGFDLDVAPLFEDFKAARLVGGFILHEVIAITPDGVVDDFDAGAVATQHYTELPLEDVMRLELLLQDWIKDPRSVRDISNDETE